MKERPILFSAPMVRAILAGKKTQTRREVNRLNGLGSVTCFGGSETSGYDFALRDRRDMWNEFREDELLARCPYGVAGDRLWVRETWALCINVIDGETEAVHKAGPWRNENEPSLKWKPSIHMPRWASRITLEVVAVRVERLQDITDKDVFCEGIQQAVDEGLQGDGSARGAFIELWESINGPDSWPANPWVWVVEFKRLKGGA